MTFHPAAHPGDQGRGWGGQGVGRLDSHLAHSLGGSGETARNIFRSSLNREERKAISLLLCLWGRKKREKELDKKIVRKILFKSI